VADAQAPELPPRPLGTPWYVRVMTGFGAWLGGLFLLGWLMALFSLVLRSSDGMLILGVSVLIAAFFLYRVARDSEAVQQLALACSMAGQFSLAFGAQEAFHWDTITLAGFLCMLQTFLALVMAGVLHRFLSAWFAAMAGYYFLFQVQAVAFGGALLAVAVTWLWLNEAMWTAARRAPLLRPVGYALALALLFWEAPFSLRWALDWHYDALRLGVPYWLAPLAYSLCVAAAAGILARRYAPAKAVAWVLAAVLVCAAGWLAPGLLAALLVLILGQATGRRVLVGLALLAAVWYLGTYYYQMQITLLQKSGVMVATGVLLIGLRFLLALLWPEKKT
jgi:uncharacterized membrane protein